MHAKSIKCKAPGAGPYWGLTAIPGPSLISKAASNMASLISKAATWLRLAHYLPSFLSDARLRFARKQG